MVTITLLGTGKLSFNFMNEILKNKSLHLNQIYGRSKFRPKHISDNIDYIKDIHNLKESDFYFLCVSDSQISKISNTLHSKDKVVLHLSGSTEIDVLSGHKNFFFGSDSAPHYKKLKFNNECCAGVYSTKYSISNIIEFFSSC